MRNIIEGIIFFLVISIIVFILPIPSLRAKIILAILIGGSAGMLGIIGISHYSVTEFLMLFFRFKKQPKNVKKKQMFYTRAEKHTIQNESTIESEVNHNENRKRK